MFIDRDNIICIMNNMDNNISMKYLLVVSMCLGRPREIFQIRECL